MREFNITAYKWLAQRVRAPLNVAETSDGVHMNTADFIQSGCATFVRTSTELRGGLPGRCELPTSPTPFAFVLSLTATQHARPSAWRFPIARITSLS